MPTYSRVDINFPYGDGIYLYDNNGTKYLDFLSGIAVTSLGHGDKDLKKRRKELILDKTIKLNSDFSLHPILKGFNELWNEKKGAKEGISILMVSTTGEEYSYYVLDKDLVPQKKKFPERLVKTVDLIEENCEPALCTVMFVGGAGGSLRSGVTKNPVKLTRSIHKKNTKITSGGAEPFVWPGGGITFMVNVLDMPENAFGYVPTPAIVAPLEFTMPKSDYETLGGYTENIRTIEDIFAKGGEYGSNKKIIET